MDNNNINILVMGASTNPQRYSYKAVIALLEKGYRVIAFGRRSNMIKDTQIISDLDQIPNDIHTISLYLNEGNQLEYESKISSIKPKRVIFNPGAENYPLYKKLRGEGIEVINGCTLVMLSIGNF